MEDADTPRERTRRRSKDELHRDLQRYCCLLSRITDEAAIRFLIEMMGEAALRLKEIESLEKISEE
ncbi:MAG TPA: hypothetical protein VMA53_01140 [Stellaceae bacterium]|nr:hypothetical protein [Stellaceae bacterium]